MAKKNADFCSMAISLAAKRQICEVANDRKKSGLHSCSKKDVGSVLIDLGYKALKGGEAQ